MSAKPVERRVLEWQPQNIATVLKAKPCLFVKEAIRVEDSQKSAFKKFTELFGRLELYDGNTTTGEYAFHIKNGWIAPGKDRYGHFSCLDLCDPFLLEIVKSTAASFPIEKDLTYEVRVSLSHGQMGFAGWYEIFFSQSIEWVAKYIIAQSKEGISGSEMTIWDSNYKEIGKGTVEKQFEGCFLKKHEHVICESRRKFEKDAFEDVLVIGIGRSPEIDQEPQKELYEFERRFPSEEEIDEYWKQAKAAIDDGPA